MQDNTGEAGEWRVRLCGERAVLGRQKDVRVGWHLSTHNPDFGAREIQELYGQQIPPELLQDDLHAQLGGPPEPRLLPGEAEPVPEEMQADEPQGGPHEPEQLVYDEVGDDFVMVNGLKLTTASSRKVMKDACEFLGIPLSGSKAVVFRRLQTAVRETAVKAALDAARN